MEREIRFRAWDKNRKRMIRDVWSLPLSELAGGHGSEPEELMGDDGQRTNWYELMQYTGFKDKNGKEIYEGDILDCMEILSSTPVGGETEYYRCQVMFSEVHGGFMFEENEDSAHWFQSFDEVEIIGNIHENPELLETAKIK